jgi:hypothetical protein
MFPSQKPRALHLLARFACGAGEYVVISLDQNACVFPIRRIADQSLRYWLSCPQTASKPPFVTIWNRHTTKKAGEILSGLVALLQLHLVID